MSDLDKLSLPRDPHEAFIKIPKKHEDSILSEALHAWSAGAAERCIVKAENNLGDIKWILLYNGVR